MNASDCMTAAKRTDAPLRKEIYSSTTNSSGTALSLVCVDGDLSGLHLQALKRVAKLLAIDSGRDYSPDIALLRRCRMSCMYIYRLLTGFQKRTRGRWAFGELRWDLFQC